MPPKKKLDTSTEYVKELERIFNRFNTHFWDGKLPDVFITFLPTPTSLGHMSVSPRWVQVKNKKKKYELNISALVIDRKPEEICGILLHEQVHLYCMDNEIKDTSNNYRYHNKNFKRVAEDHGLNVKYVDRVVGWSETVLDDEAKKYVKKIKVKQFRYHRVLSTSKTKLLRYQCHGCGEVPSVCWCSKPQKIICARCLQMMKYTPTTREIIRRLPGI